MTRIYRTDGFYMTHIRAKNSFNHSCNFICIGVFFVQNYMCFIWEPTGDPVVVNSGFLSNMAEWRQEIFEAIKSGEIDDTDSKYIYARFIEKPNGIFEARFSDEVDSVGYKDIVLLPRIFGGISLIVDTYSQYYDFDFPEKSGYKEKRIVDSETMKFYKY